MAQYVTGMDLDKLEAFWSEIKESPIVLGLETRGKWASHSGRSTIHTGCFQ